MLASVAMVAFYRVDLASSSIPAEEYVSGSVTETWAAVSCGLVMSWV